ncbi:hypothetical protein D3C85_1066980 [compost metagenome]
MRNPQMINNRLHHPLLVEGIVRAIIHKREVMQDELLNNGPTIARRSIQNRKISIPAAALSNLEPNIVNEPVRLVITIGRFHIVWFLGTLFCS